MPGRRLNSVEKRLEQLWLNNATPEYPHLRSIEVLGPAPGLRGVSNLNLEFSYPVTVLIGQNGAGKSTVLSLAALAYHGVDGHFPRNAKRMARRGESFTYYTFQDFFFRGVGDPDVAGVSIKWTFSDSSNLSIRKQTDKWMRYERRIPRPVQFFGISRAVPAIEQSVLRGHFGQQSKVGAVAYSNESVAYVARILRRGYSGAESLVSARWGVRRCSSSVGNVYSSFNMGAGEDILFDMIGSIMSLPNGSLVVIEEIELGIHASALRELAQVLIEIALKKRLQIIISSHSEQFVDALPRQARIMLRRNDDSHTAMPSPSTGFVFANLSGQAVPELIVYCEDVFAKKLIESSLSFDIRSRVKVIPVGDKNALAIQGECHVRDGNRPPCVVVFDGDVTDAEAERMVRNANGRLQGASVNWLKLPGSEAPEIHVVNQIIQSEAAMQALSNELRVTDVSSLRVTLNRAITVDDHHDISRSIANEMGIGEDEIILAMCRSVAREVPQFVTLADSVSNFL